MISIVLLGSDLSRTVAVEEREPVEVVLEDVSTTGYQWRADSLDAGRAIITDLGVAPGEAPGASGRRRFQIVPLVKGRMVVRFTLSRSWESSAEAAQQAALTIDVD